MVDWVFSVGIGANWIKQIRQEFELGSPVPLPAPITIILLAHLYIAMDTEFSSIRQTWYFMLLNRLFQCSGSSEKKIQFNNNYEQATFVNRVVAKVEPDYITDKELPALCRNFIAINSKKPAFSLPYCTLLFQYIFILNYY